MHPTQSTVLVSSAHEPVCLPVQVTEQRSVGIAVDRLIAETDEAGNMLKAYLWLIGQAVAMAANDAAIHAGIIAASRVSGKDYLSEILPDYLRD